MKKILLTVLLIVLSLGTAFAVTPVIEGVGAPYTLTASEAGLIYVDMSNTQKWVSNSTTKGDWAKVSTVVEDGSVTVPFTVLNFMPIATPTTNLSTGTTFIDSNDNVMYTLTDTTTGANVWTAHYEL